MVVRFASNGSGFIQMGTRGELRRYGHQFLPFPYAVLKGIPKFYQEAIMWKHEKHPNIVPFRGVTIVPLQLIFDWMSGGNIMEYITEHPGADRLGLVRFFLVLREVEFSPTHSSCAGSLRA